MNFILIHSVVGHTGCGHDQDDGKGDGRFCVEEDTEHGGSRREIGRWYRQDHLIQ